MRPRSSGTVNEAGITLCVCSIILFGVALLISASLRTVDDSISLAHAYIDRQLAQRAADAALDDGAKTLLMRPAPLTADQAQATHAIGGVTGQVFPYGGRLQSRELPVYVLERLAPADGKASSPGDAAVSDIYRITAHGTGYLAQTRSALQAEFELRQCPSVAVDESGSPQDERSQGRDCVPGLRQLWRRPLYRRQSCRHRLSSVRPRTGMRIGIGRRRCGGVTLTELLITLVVVGLLGAIALPGFGQMLDRLRVVAASAQFQQALRLARAEAMRRRTRVDLIPLRNTDWASGWQVLIDADNNQRLNAGDTLLHTGPLLPPGLRIDARLRDPKAYVAFDVSGRPRSATSSAVPQIGSFVFVAGDEQRKIIISFLGRVRSCDPVREKASC